MDEFITIPRINREFSYLGWKSSYEVVLPKEGKVRLVGEYLEREKAGEKEGRSEEGFNNERVNYANIEWCMYARHIHEQQ